MTTQLPWNFEPCENEGPICDPKGTPWAHAVRGRKLQRPVVTGYGHTPKAADADARTKASQNDAREVLGERGEVVIQLRLSTCWIDDKCMMTVYDMETNTALVQGHLVLSDIYPPPDKSRMSGLGSVCPSWNSSWQSIGT